MPARREWRSRRRSGAAVTTTFVDDPAGDAAANLRLGASIRHLRHARGRTLVQLAEATGLSHPFLSQLERGLAQPSLSSLRRTALALPTSPIELIAAADAHPPPTSRAAVHRRADGRRDDTFPPGSPRMLAAGSPPAPSPADADPPTY